MSEELPPRRKLDVLYKEIIGEIGPLLERMESLAGQVTQLLLQSQSLPKDLAESLVQARSQIHQDQSQLLSQFGAHMQKLADETASHIKQTEKNTKKITRTALWLGLSAGSMGGILAGLAMGSFI